MPTGLTGKRYRPFRRLRRFACGRRVEEVTHESSTPPTRDASRLSAVVGALARTGASGRSVAIAAMLVFLAVASVVSAYDAVRPRHSLVAGAGGDFSAFYCAGSALDRQKNPYLVEPLRGCEHRVQPFGESAEVVDPAPLPRYALTPFALLAYVPYDAAKGLWLMLLLASVCVTAFVLARLTGLPLLPVLLGLGFVDGYVEFSFGQIPPLVVAMIALSGYCAERGAYRSAGLLAAATLIEPQLGLPVLLAAFLWWPRARIPLVASVLALGALEVYAGGIQGTLAYLERVLPDQARSELVASDQYGLSHELFAFGVPADFALRAGAASYAIAVATGLVLARRVASALDAESLIAFVPVAIALLGGTYNHDVQFAAALPAAFVITARAIAWRPIALASLALLIFPWLSVGTIPRMGIVAGGLVFAIAATLWIAAIALRVRTSRALTGVAACIVLAYVFILAIDRRLPAAPAYRATAIAASAADPRASASQNWGAYLRSEPSLSAWSPRREAAKIPYWFAVTLLAIVASLQPARRAPSGMSVSKRPLEVSARPAGAFALRAQSDRLPD